MKHTLNVRKIKKIRRLIEEEGILYDPPTYSNVKINTSYGVPYIPTTSAGKHKPRKKKRKIVKPKETLSKYYLNKMAKIITKFEGMAHVWDNYLNDRNGVTLEDVKTHIKYYERLMRR